MTGNIVVTGAFDSMIDLQMAHKGKISWNSEGCGSAGLMFWFVLNRLAGLTPYCDG
jgi:hypothetical protein